MTDFCQGFTAAIALISVGVIALALRTHRDWSASVDREAKAH